MVSTNKSLYLYESPFLVADTQDNRYTYLSETARLNEFEREDENQILDVIFKFAIEHDLVSMTKEGNEVIFTHTNESNVGSWNWVVTWMSFRSLVDDVERFKLINILESSNQHWAGLILDLHTRLGVLFDHMSLNVLANRTIKAIGLIPHKTEKGTNLSPWEYIHQTAPFIWLIIVLQSVIRTRCNISS